MGLGLALVPQARALDRLTLSVPDASDRLEEALSAASLLVAARDEGVSDPQELLAAARADYARLLAVLYDSGRFGGTISIRLDGQEAATVQPLDAPASVRQIEISVTPGPAYKFSAADISPRADHTELPEGFAPGQTARAGVIREAASAAIEGWRDAGRAKATIKDQTLVADHETDTISAEIEVSPGPAVTFGDTIPRGYSAVRPERIVEIAGIPKGRDFRPATLEEAATRLRRSGTFNSVALTEAETLGPDDSLDVTVLVEEAKPRRIGFGAEVSSVDGLTLSGYWLHRNLLGGAERLRFDGEIAQIGTSDGGEDYTFSVSLDRPSTGRANADLYVIGTLEHLNEPSYTSDTAEIEAGFNRILSPKFSISYGLGARYSRVTDDSDTEDFQMLTMPVTVTYDHRDSTLSPTRGGYGKLEMMPFLGLADTDSGARLNFDGRYYKGLGSSGRVVLAGRVQAGSIIGASADGVPDDLLFFSGGGSTVRGQEYESLGVLEDGVETGGRAFLGIQAEARVGITEKIGLVAFYDWGTVSADSLPGGSGRDHSGAGLGLRYTTPIGPIRLDVATPVSGDSDGDKVKIYLGIGQAF